MHFVIKKTLKYLIAILAPIYPTVTFGGQTDGWIEGRLKHMSLHEKVGQLIMIDFDEKVMDPNLAAHIDEGFYGNFIIFDKNIETSEQLKALLYQITERVTMRTGIPPMIAVDQEGGQVNRIGKRLKIKNSQFEAKTIGQAFYYKESKARRALSRYNYLLGQEMKSLGINTNLAPVLDLTSDPKSSVYSRSFGNNPKIVSNIGEIISGSMHSAGLIVTGKHFPNLGSSTIDSHKNLPVIHRRLPDLKSHEFYPFYHLRDALDIIMVGHAIVPSIDPKLPASLSPTINRILRREIGFRGVIISDDLKMKAITKYYTFEDMIKKSLIAGTDILLLAAGRENHKKAFDLILSLVRQGTVPISQIDSSVRRILEVKRRYLFDRESQNNIISLDVPHPVNW